MLNVAKTLLPWLGIFVSIVLAFVVIPEAVEGIETAIDAPHYRSTRAEVTSQYEKKHNKGPSSYIVKFDYKVADRKLHGTNHFTSWTDSETSLKPLIRKEDDGRKTMLVYYDPQNPKRVVIHKDVPTWPHFLWIIGTIFIFVLSVVSAVIDVKKKQYLKKSQAAMDKISLSKPSKNS